MRLDNGSGRKMSPDEIHEHPAPMMKPALLSIVIAFVVLVLQHSHAEERYVEDYVETDNCARI